MTFAQSFRQHVDGQNPKAFTARLRAKRLAPFRAEVRRVHAAKGRVRVLDLGGTAAYWEALLPGFLEEYNVSIDLLNLEPGRSNGRYTAIQGDACTLPPGLGQYDICHSNSVIEHVGVTRWRQFAETARNAAPAYMVQTPNFWFPVEPHYLLPFVHWMPRPWAAAILKGRRVGLHLQFPDDWAGTWAAMEDQTLLTAKVMRDLFPDARLIRERIGPLTKSLTAYRPGTA